MANARDELADMRIVIAESYEDKEPLTQNQKDSCKCFWKYGKHIDEHLQALEIIVKKGIDVEVIKTSNNVRAYNFETRFIRYHRDELTQEEYDLVSKVVKEIFVNE